MNRGIVAIVGRPNVGKSSVFNRLVQDNLAITDDQSGITRDRLYGKCEWLDQKFSVIDTGGIELKNVPFMDEIIAQARQEAPHQTIDALLQNKSLFQNRHLQGEMDFMSHNLKRFENALDRKL